METIQIVIDSALRRAADGAAKRARINRSALIRKALREYLNGLSVREREARDRRVQGTSGHLGFELGAGAIVAAGVMRGEIRLCRLPSPDKQRPVVVLTRSTAIPYLSSLTVAPITSSIRGVPSEVVLTEDDGMKHPCAVNLHNVLTVSKTHLGRRLATLSSERLAEICAAVGFALGCSG